MTHELESKGFSIVSDVLSSEEVHELVCSLGSVSGAGRRGLLAVPAIARLARSPKLLGFVRPYLPLEPLPVRAIYFNKAPEANWLVAWHQDLTLALRTRAELPGFGPWSTKGGIPHVQPPVELLQQMIAIRLHLDDTDESNGALRVVPGSHRLGRLPASRIQQLCKEQPAFLCKVSAGDAMIMRPLLLHSSRRSSSTTHRRVLHIEYSGFRLPAGLEWHPSA